MQSGSIRVACHEGDCMVRLEGDVRLTLCAAFDAFIDQVAENEHLNSVLVDCTDAENMDSTTLGQLVRLGLKARERLGMLPVLFCPDADLRRLLVSMGFDDVFTIETQAFTAFKGLECLAAGSPSEEEVRERVLEAHRSLMSLNEHNRLAFHELVNSLERDRSL